MAGALVGVGRGVTTQASIVTRVMASAEIQIWNEKCKGVMYMYRKEGRKCFI